MPSHIVDCEHTHDEEPAKEDADVHEHGHEHVHEHEHPPAPRPQRPRTSSLPGHLHRADSERRPKSRPQSSYFGSQATALHTPTAEPDVSSQALPISRPQGVSRRPSLQARLTTTISKIVKGKNDGCTCDGPCYGYSEPCGQECFKNVNSRGGYRAPVRMGSSTSARPPMSKSATAQSVLPHSETTPLLQDIAEEPRPLPPQSRHLSETAADMLQEESDLERGQSDSNSETLLNGNADDDGLHKAHTNETTSSHNPDHHHHHVPTNAFLSIGLQTSIAIALHKLPEGFITYATNHANPKLGFAVFLALFIHNITEGFAMALPLYLAINNRFKAMAISFVLGGLSQPIGAGVAALWFKLAGKGDWAPSEGVYGAMFAVTAGIMASVALQLFSESLDLTHSRMLCLSFAFIGMGILGISSALTA
ncbi:hypothetical protein LTR85_005167 [Meristemomyces frigidus]|nr:hypothetical protein LTR85_005167 [Meristemomyces frigidus]